MSFMLETFRLIYICSNLSQFQLWSYICNKEMQSHFPSECERVFIGDVGSYGQICLFAFRNVMLVDLIVWSVGTSGGNQTIGTVL